MVSREGSVAAGLSRERRPPGLIPLRAGVVWVLREKLVRGSRGMRGCAPFVLPRDSFCPTHLHTNPRSSSPSPPYRRPKVPGHDLGAVCHRRDGPRRRICGRGPVHESCHRNDPGAWRCVDFDCFAACSGVSFVRGGQGGWVGCCGCGCGICGRAGSLCLLRCEAFLLRCGAAWPGLERQFIALGSGPKPDAFCASFFSNTHPFTHPYPPPPTRLPSSAAPTTTRRPPRSSARPSPPTAPTPWPEIPNTTALSLRTACRGSQPAEVPGECRGAGAAGSFSRRGAAGLGGRSRCRGAGRPPPPAAAAAGTAIVKGKGTGKSNGRAGAEEEAAVGGP